MFSFDHTSHGPIVAETELEPRDPGNSDAWRRRVGAFALVILGLIVFEISASPSLGVAIACLKFGWDDARDGAWLRRVDPNRQRGRACSWIYLGVGFFKASLIAFLGAVAMAIFAAQFGIRLGWPRQLLAAQLFGALAVGLLGVTLSTMASLVAIFIAWRARVKLWVGPEARRARDRGEWPPRVEYGGIARRNRVGPTLILTIAGVAMLVFFVVIGLMLATPLLQRARALGGLVVVFLVPIGSGIYLLMMRDFLLIRIIANQPADCWPVAFENTDRFSIASVDDLE